LLLQGFCADADDAALPDQSQAGLFILFLGSFASWSSGMPYILMLWSWCLRSWRWRSFG